MKMLKRLLKGEKLIKNWNSHLGCVGDKGYPVIETKEIDEFGNTIYRCPKCRRIMFNMWDGDKACPKCSFKKKVKKKWKDINVQNAKKY